MHFQIRRTRDRFDKGGIGAQILLSLRKAAAASGITTKLATHDIRPGAAREAAVQHTKCSMDKAAVALGHAAWTVCKGTTGAYIGHIGNSDFKKRIQQPAGDVFALDVTDIQAPANLKRPLRFDDDLRLPLRKKTASEVNAGGADWPANRQSVRTTKGQDEAPNTVDPTEHTEDHPVLLNPALLHMAGLAEPGTQVDDGQVASLGCVLDDGDVQDHQARDILEGSSEGPARIEDPQLIGSRGLALEGTRNECISLLTTINLHWGCMSDITSNQAMITRITESRSGGTRDEPSASTHECPNPWCTYENVLPSLLREHMFDCTPERAAAEAAKADENTAFELRC